MFATWSVIIWPMLPAIFKNYYPNVPETAYGRACFTTSLNCLKSRSDVVVISGVIQSTKFIEAMYSTVLTISILYLSPDEIPSKFK